MTKSNSYMSDLDAALQGVAPVPDAQETSLNPVIDQATRVLADDSYSTDSLKALRDRLDAKEGQLRALQRELRQRDERIAQLERLCISEQTQDAVRSRQLAAMGLVLESLSEPGVTYRIKRVTTTLGRDDSNDIVLNRESVSRYHARLVVTTDSTYLIDLGSTNGCKVNGERVSRQSINSGDLIAIGDADFRFSAGLPLSDADDASLDETHVMLDDSVIFIADETPKSKVAAESGVSLEHKPK